MRLEGALAIALALLAASCAVPIEARRLDAWQARRVGRVVVLPFAPTGERVSEGAAELVTARVLEALAACEGVEVISPVDVRIALERAGDDERAALVGAFGPDALLEGRVRRFEGAVGPSGGPSGPGHVEFELRLLAPDGALLWEGSYAERQRALSEDLSSLERAFERGMRWVSPESLAGYGARALVSALDREIRRARAEAPPLPRRDARPGP